MALIDRHQSSDETRSTAGARQPMRAFLKGLSLTLLILGPAWAVITLVAGFVIAGPPADFEAFGAILDAVFRWLTPNLIAGGVLWLLVRIDERLEQRTL